MKRVRVLSGKFAPDCRAELRREGQLLYDDDLPASGIRSGDVRPDDTTPGTTHRSLDAESLRISTLRGFRRSEISALVLLATSGVGPQAVRARDAEPTLGAPTLTMQPPGHHEC
jgi:hypothetical protein